MYDVLGENFGRERLMEMGQELVVGNTSLNNKYLNNYVFIDESGWWGVD